MHDMNATNDMFCQISGYSLQRAESWVDLIKLCDVVVGHILWDFFFVKELQVGFIHQEHWSLEKYQHTGQ